MGIYYRSLWMEELSIGETVYFGLGLLVFYVITYARGVRSFLNKRIVYFNFVPRSHEKLIQYGMTYTFIRIAIANAVVVVAMLPVLLKSIGVTKVQVVLFWLFFTIFRFMLSLLTRFIHVRVGKQWLLWVIKNVIFSISLSFLE